MCHITTRGGGTCGKRSAVDYSAKGSHVMVWFGLLKQRLWSYEVLPTSDTVVYHQLLLRDAAFTVPAWKYRANSLVDFGKTSELCHCDQTPQVAWYSGQWGAKWNALTQRITKGHSGRSHGTDQKKPEHLHQKLGSHHLRCFWLRLETSSSVGQAFGKAQLAAVVAICWRELDIVTHHTVFIIMYLRMFNKLL